MWFEEYSVLCIEICPCLVLIFDSQSCPVPRGSEDCPHIGLLTILQVFILFISLSFQLFTDERIHTFLLNANILRPALDLTLHCVPMALTCQKPNPINLLEQCTGRFGLLKIFLYPDTVLQTEGYRLVSKKCMQYLLVHFLRFSSFLCKDNSDKSEVSLILSSFKKIQDVI